MCESVACVEDEKCVKILAGIEGRDHSEHLDVDGG